MSTLDQLLTLDAKYQAIFDMEDVNHYLFNLKQKGDVNVNYTQNNQNTSISHCNY